jgi:hypothetical protein
MRRTRIEHILSALPPLATEERTFGIGSSVPKPDVSNRSKQRGYSITSSALCESTAALEETEWAKTNGIRAFARNSKEMR